MALTRHKIQGYGWIPDIPDHRDHLYAAPVVNLAKLPKKVDLRPQCPKVVYDQGQLGSCTGNAIAGAFQFERHKQKLKPDFIPSRLFIYYNERVIEGTVGFGQRRVDPRRHQERGDARRLPRKASGPTTSRSSRRSRPKAAFTQALRYKAIQYQRVSRILNQMKGCMASGYPFVFGFSVYESFESQAVARTGVVPMPAPSETLLGGHAVLAVGYDDATQRFIVRNSWGPKWGMRGYFTMPYDYLLDAGSVGRLLDHPRDRALGAPLQESSPSLQDQLAHELRSDDLAHRAAIGKGLVLLGERARDRRRDGIEFGGLVEGRHVRIGDEQDHVRILGAARLGHEYLVAHDQPGFPAGFHLRPCRTGRGSFMYSSNWPGLVLMNVTSVTGPSR